MNKKEITEIRKQFKYTGDTGTMSIDRMCGYYVDATGDVLSVFNKNFLSLDEDELIKWIELFKKGIFNNGSVTKEFPAEAETTGNIQDSLVKLRDDGLQTEAVYKGFFESLAETDSLIRNRLYVLIHNVYDVPEAGADSKDVFDYVMGFIFPVELPKPSLSFNDTGEVQKTDRQWEIKAPEFSFIFPSFEDRQADIHSITCFIKKQQSYYSELMKSFFNLGDVISKDFEKDAFVNATSQAMAELKIPDADKANIVAEIAELANDKVKDSPNPDEETVSIEEIKEVFVNHNHIEAAETFEKQYTTDIPYPTVSIGSILQSATLYTSSGIKLIADNDTAPQIEIKHIDGQDYITVPIYEGVTINGVKL